MKKENKNLQANLEAIKNLAREMQKEWGLWRRAPQGSKEKQAAFARYVAAHTGCKVYLQNMISKFFSEGRAVPKDIQQSLEAILQDMHLIEKIHETNFQKLLQDIDRLDRKAA